MIDWQAIQQLQCERPYFWSPLCEKDRVQRAPFQVSLMSGGQMEVVCLLRSLYRYMCDQYYHEGYSFIVVASVHGHTSS